MSKLSEYAEQIVADGFKRQLDQQEDAVRTLPLIIAGAGFVGTMLHTLHPRLCKFDPHGILSVILYLDAWTMFFAMLATLYGLVGMIRQHRYQYPMDEVAFLNYVRAMSAYYGQAENADEAALADVRETIAEQLAEAARVNRRNNEAKLRGRNLSLNGLVVLIILAFCMISIVYLRHVVAPGACHA